MQDPIQYPPSFTARLRGITARKLWKFGIYLLLAGLVFMVIAGVTDATVWLKLGAWTFCGGFALLIIAKLYSYVEWFLDASSPQSAEPGTSDDGSAK